MKNCNTCYPSTVTCGGDEYLISGLDPDTNYWVILTDRFGNKYRLGTPDNDDFTPSDSTGVFSFVMPEGMDDPNAGSYRIQIFTDENLCFPYTITICEVEYTCINLSFVKMTGLSLGNLICACDPCPTSCMTLTEIPDPMPTYPDDCPSGIIKVEVEANKTDYFIWSGGGWAEIVVDSVTATETFGSLPSGWEVSFDGGATWIDRDTWSTGYTFPSVMTEVTFMYRSPEGCVYTGRTTIQTHLRIVFGIIDEGNLPAWLSAWDNLAEWNAVLAAGLEDVNSQQFTSLVVDVDNATIDFYGGIGCNTSFPIAPPWPSFLNYANIISVEDFDGCIVSWHHSFFYGSSLRNLRLHGATTMTATDTGNHGRQFLSCLQLAEIYAPLCDGFGATVGDDDVFRFISGNTIDATFMASLQTINAGGVEGDIAYLQTNNTVNITWV